MAILSGREDEKKLFTAMLEDKQAHLVAVVGRRRIGKTYLVRTFFEKEMVFDFTGQKDADFKRQLVNFVAKLSEVMKLEVPLATPQNWNDAFDLLRTYLGKKRKKKSVIFLDEVPWIATPKGGFLEAFDYFWNDFGVKQNLILVLCGSNTSWMIDNIASDKGGLHNRITRYIYLKPFTFKETLTYFKDRKISFPLNDHVLLYMALGGVAYYLSHVERGESVQQAIDRICFAESAPLRLEFQNLYAALFNNHENYEAIVRVLATKRQGITRKQLITETRFTNGGWLSKILNDLELAGFLHSYTPFGKVKRETLYRLTDEFSFFYLLFMDKKGKKKIKEWQQYTTTQSYKSWSGFAFEGFCLKHVQDLKQALGIAGIYTESYTYTSKEPEKFQIDLLIDRADNAINLCEMKFYNTEYMLTESEAKRLRLRKAGFVTETGTRKQIVTTLITNYGLMKNAYSEAADKVITLKEIFDN